MTIAALPISRTKVIVPKLRPEVVHRSRLLALFGDLLDKKLILITAPAGYGKTTLMIDFAKWAEMPVCWLSLDALDKDPQRFIAYLLAAIGERYPKFGKQSIAELRSVTNLALDSERLLSTITNEIYDQIDEHFALVIDDYHLVDPIPAIREFLSHFTNLVGENCHVILASRRLPTLPDIALMVARQQVGGFDLEQLAFRHEEIRLLVEKTQGMRPADQVVDELLHQTEGWITGLLLAISGAGRAEPIHTDTAYKTNLYHAARSAGVTLTGYFDQQILAPQPAELREFLLQSSLLQEFDVDLCNAVLGAGRWKDLIETIQRNNLFILQVGLNGQWLRYHRLFQEFLQERMQHDEPDVARAILGRLADVYEEQGEWEKAHAVYQQFANAGLLAGLLERSGTALLLSERLVTLAGWLDELPASLLRERPALQSLKAALLCARGEGRSALAMLDQAIPELENKNIIPDLGLGYVRRAAAFRLTGEYSLSIKDTEAALNLCGNRSDMLSVLAEAQLFKGISLNSLGQTIEAIASYQEALHRFQQLNEAQSIARVQMCLGDSYQNIHNYQAAQNAYELALNEWQKESNLSWQANVLNSLGVMFHQQGDYERAVRSFEEGLTCARRGASSIREALLLTSLGDIYIDLDEFGPAGLAFTNAAHISNRISYQFLSSYLNLAQARLARHLGHYKEASVFLAKCESSLRSHGTDPERGHFHLERGRLRLMEKNSDASRVDFRSALDLFNKSSQLPDARICKIWLAACAVEEGSESASADLQEALKPVPDGERQVPFLQEMRHARSWLIKLREDDEIRPQLDPWLEKISLEEKRLNSLRKQLRRLLTSVPIQAPELNIQAFGKTRVRVNGKVVTVKQWRTSSVRELFFFFLSRTHPISKDEIGEILWTESNPEQLKLRFKNELYRLRHALGQDVIVFEDNLYSFNRLLDFDYDVENFESHLAKARLAIKSEEKVKHLQAAVSLHQGPYIKDVDATWALVMRERLEQACLEAYKELAELQFRSGEIQAALQACQDALKIDSCREDFHRLAMQLHAHKGDRLGVIWQYQACREAMRTELDLTISEETEALYQRLIA